MTSLVEYMDKYKQYRHVLAHGAFYQSNDPAVLKGQYTHIHHSTKGKSYLSEERELTEKIVLDGVYDADRLLRILIAFREKKEAAIILTLFQRKMQAAIP